MSIIAWRLKHELVFSQVAARELEIAILAFPVSNFLLQYV